MTWLEKIEENLSTIPDDAYGVVIYANPSEMKRMVRVIRELARYTKDFAIEMGGMHIFKDSYKDELSDEVMELIEEVQ